jgi:DNA invertase Pin-like site-specific DNA recombinase
MSRALKGRQPSEQCKAAALIAVKNRKYTPEQIIKKRIRFSGEGNPAFRRDVSNERIRELLAEGHKPAAIAAKLNAPYLMVYRRCKKLGYLAGSPNV